MPDMIRRISVDPAFSVFVAATLTVLATLTTSCTSTLAVDVDEHEDFSQYRTWDWMPQLRSRVLAPGENLPALDLRVADLIEEHLESRGLKRSDAPADFYVTYHLTIQQKSERVEQPMASYLLSSYSSAPSYWVGGTESVERRFDDFRLAIAITRGGSRMTWQASIEDRLNPADDLPLEKTVARILDRLPTLGPPVDSTEAR